MGQGEEVGGEARWYLDPEAYLVPAEDGNRLLYAPLLGVALLVDPRAARWLEGAQSPLGAAAEPGDLDLAQPLARLGLMGRAPALPRVAAPRVAPPFEPVNLTLFLTSACNLRCAYCYSSGGDSPQTMPEQLALDAVALVAGNASRTSRKVAALHFHGGGEPTLARELMRGVIEKARGIARERGVTLELALGTNGVMPEDAARWVAATFDNVTLSIDGPSEIHDAQRPRADGGPSHEAALRTAQLFDALGFSYALRVTATDATVERMDEVVEHLTGASAARKIKVEPLFVQGRALEGGLPHPDPERFVEAFARARRRAARLGRELIYSACRPQAVTDRFCAATLGSICVTPRGELTACYEVTSLEDARAPLFFFGRHRAHDGGFDLDYQVIARLQALTVDGAAECAGCFAKWHCAGDCPAKVLAPASRASARALHRTWRCRITRGLLRDELLERLRGEEDLLGGAA